MKGGRLERINPIDTMMPRFPPVGRYCNYGNVMRANWRILRERER